MRIVCRFSCGAASAVATKLAVARFGPENIVIFNAEIKEEHFDNRRFAKDCESWFGVPITVLRNEKYNGSVDEVWRRKRFINSLYGAPCSMHLKREVLDAACGDGDRHVFGFTVEEKSRAEPFRRGGAILPLVDGGLTKADCLAIVENAGIQLPKMYRLGFNNANCIGCCKGGMGYWNKVRDVFPERYAEVQQIQEEIGEKAYFFRDRVTGKRFGLKDLNPKAGRHNEILPECSFLCAIAEDEIDV